jgi:putative acetyltransferase
VKTISVSVREMLREDARAFLEIHHAAVRGLAARDYPPEVVHAWAPLPITDSDVERVRANLEGEYRMVAEIDGRVVGIGVLAASNNELRACYVAPEVSRNGVASALIRELEQTARKQNLTMLEVDSSVAAEPFYLAHGYEFCERGEHILNNGQPMACVKMRKQLV